MPPQTLHVVVGEHENDYRVPLSLHESSDAAVAAAADYRRRDRPAVAPYESLAGSAPSYVNDRFDRYNVEEWPVERSANQRDTGATRSDAIRSDAIRSDGSGSGDRSDREGAGIDDPVRQRRIRTLPAVVAASVFVAGSTLLAIALSAAPTVSSGEAASLGAAVLLIAAVTYLVTASVSSAVRSAIGGRRRNEVADR